ncbi:hypothetical protein D3C73_630230 [compost metagenome]
MLKEFHFAQQLGTADHDHRRNGDTGERTHAAQDHDGEDDRRFQEDEAFRRDEPLAGSEERAGETAEHCARGERRQFGGDGVDAERTAGDLVLTQCFPGAADRHAPQANGDVCRQHAECQNDIEQEHLVIDRRGRQTPGLGKIVRRACVEGPDTEEGRLLDARDAERAAGDIRPVDQHEADDFTEGERHDRKIVSSQPQNRETEDNAPERGQNAGHRQEQPEGEAEMGRQQRVGIGADRVEGDITQIEQAREADDDVETPGEHHVDEDLDAKVVDIFQRALTAEDEHCQERIAEQEDQCDLEEMRAEEALLVRDFQNAALRLGELAAVEMRLDETDRHEAADGGNRDEDRKQPPARAPDQLVVDVLIGLDADEQQEHAERDQARENAFLDGLCHLAGLVVFSGVSHVRPSPLPDDRECRSA